jgi:hypothetical protein
MKKFYLSALGNVCPFLSLPLIFTLFFTSPANAQKMVTYDTTFNGWNAIVTEDVSLAGKDSVPGIVFFPGIGQQTKNLADLLVNGPHYLISNGLWDGSVSLGNGVHHPFIISLQPPAPYYPPESVKPAIDAILARYRIKRNSFYFTGLSQGAWQANLFIAYEPTKGDDTYGRMVKAIVNLEGVTPADSTSIYPSESYPRKMGHWAKACGGKELWVEGSQDFRSMAEGAQNMIDSVPNSASYFEVNYGGGAHCCWNTEYQPSVTWTAANTNIIDIVGQPQNMNVWQWMLRQGDTTMPAYSTAAVAPTANAGGDPEIVLPVTTIILTGTATGNNGATIAETSWKQVAGPATAVVVSPLNLVTVITGLTVAGNYTFELTVTDNDGLSAASDVAVVVSPAVKSSSPSSDMPPSVSAGKGQLLTLPGTSTQLNGTASGNGGATISTTAWKQVGGPVTATIVSPSGLHTVVLGMTVSGNYVFQLVATDDDGLSSNASMTVVVEPATTSGTVTVNAGSNLTVTLPANSVTLSGTAATNGGPAIGGIFWELVTGPSFVQFSNEWGLSTTVSGLVAGSYTFELSVANSSYQVSTSTVTLTVKPATTTAVTPSAMAGQAAGLTGTDSIAAAAGFSIYPNPVQGLLNIRLNNSAAGKIVVRIYNESGARVQTAELVKDQWVPLESSIDVSRLAQGVYVVQLVDGGNGRIVGKFIKQ